MVEKTVLSCGLTVISETFHDFPSISLSYTLKSGSRAETRRDSGIHHMIEHMLFKGSDCFDMKQIADLSDRLGGRLNAFTSKEITQYYIKTIAEKMELSFHLLTDLILHSIFPAEEFEKEKNVIIQEIHEAEDTPDTNAFEIFYQEVYRGNALGYPVGGWEKSVARFTRDSVFDTYRRLYRPENLVLAAAGNIEHRLLVQMAESAFSAFPPATPRHFAFRAPRFHRPDFSRANDSLNQAYVIIGFDGLSQSSPLRNRCMVMNDILGAGMSSRLFQSIREEKGLAYSISSFPDAYLDSGLMLIYANVEPEQVGAYRSAVEYEIRRLQRDGISEDELTRAKDHIKSSTVLNMESNTARMRFIANNELYLTEPQTLEEILADIEAARREEIEELFRRQFDLAQSAVLVYGQMEKFQEGGRSPRA